MPELNSIS